MTKLKPRSGCATECRTLAEATYDLAHRAQSPEVIGEFLEVAGKLLTCADRSDRGDPDPWPGAEPTRRVRTD